MCRRRVRTQTKRIKLKRNEIQSNHKHLALERNWLDVTTSRRARGSDAPTRGRLRVPFERTEFRVQFDHGADWARVHARDNETRHWQRHGQRRPAR